MRTAAIKQLVPWTDMLLVFFYDSFARRWTPRSRFQSNTLQERNCVGSKHVNRLVMRFIRWTQCYTLIYSHRVTCCSIHTPPTTIKLFFSNPTSFDSCQTIRRPFLNCSRTIIMQTWPCIKLIECVCSFHNRAHILMTFLAKGPKTTRPPKIWLWFFKNPIERYSFILAHIPPPPSGFLNSLNIIYEPHWGQRPLLCKNNNLSTFVKIENRLELICRFFSR